MIQVKKGREKYNLSAGVSMPIRTIIFAAVLAAILLAGICATPVCAGQKITRVDVSDKPGEVRIAVSAVQPITLTESRVGDRYLVFDVKGPLSWPNKKSLAIHDGGIEKVVFGWYKSNPASARISVAITERKTFTKEFSNGKRSLLIRVSKSGVRADSAHTMQKPVLVASADPFIAAASVQRPAHTISLDFVGSDIHDVLKALAVQGRVNIVAGPDVKGDVTVSLSHVTVEEALRLVTGLIGCKYSLQNGTYVVGSPSSLQTLESGSTKEENITEVVALKQAEPGQVQKMVSGQFGNLQVSVSNVNADGKRQDLNMPSMLILSGPPSSIREAKAMAQGIEDSLTSEDADGSYDIYEVKYADINELAAIVSSMVPSMRIGIGPHAGFNLKCTASTGIASTGSSGGSGSSGSTGSSGGSDTSSTSSANGKGTQTATPKLLILQGSANAVKKARAILEKMDVQQPQILLEAKVIDLSTDVSQSLGVDWTWNQMNVEEESRDPTTKSTAYDSPISSVHLGKFSRTPFEATATINAMISNGKGKVLASPQILALDGKPASIFIGDEVRYVSSVQVTTSGTNVITDTASVGVILNSISRISPDGYITMNLHPEVGVISSWIDTPDGGTLPEISRRYVDTTIRVKNGETIVIGGLIREDDTSTIAGVPILKDLPLVGQLFRSNKVSKDHSEIMIFITPKIVAP
jgi:type II secretory pathway component GspD/PulD (secretin)